MTSISTDSEARLFGEWQGRVTQALEHLKGAVEKLEEDRTTRRDYQNLDEKVTRVQDTVNNIPQIVQDAVTIAYQRAEAAFNQRLTDIGVVELRSKLDVANQKIASQEEAISTLKATAIRYGVAGGAIPAGLAILVGLVYFLVTGQKPPV